METIEFTARVVGKDKLQLSAVLRVPSVQSHYVNDCGGGEEERLRFRARSFVFPPCVTALVITNILLNL
jgi:hypothetical protein